MTESENQLLERWESLNELWEDGKSYNKLIAEMEEVEYLLIQNYNYRIKTILVKDYD